MGAEYIHFSEIEKKYGQEDLLKAQLNTLESIKHFRTFKSLRKEEFIFKISLKQKLEELKNQTRALIKLLPDVRFVKEETKHKTKSEQTLEDEIEEIRWKLEKLKLS